MTALPTVDGAEQRRLDALPEATREAALELMAELERGWPQRSGEGRWGRLLTQIEKLEDRRREVA